MSPYRKNTKINIKVLILSVVGIFVLWFLFSGIRKFQKLSMPIYPDVFINTFSNKKSLLKQVVALQDEIRSYDARLSTLSSLKIENTNLKKELGRNIDKKAILGHVIVSPNRSIYDTFTIDIGSDDGVYAGQKVYAFDSVVLGVISEVSSNTSTVLLYSSHSKETVGFITGSDTAVTLIGRGSGEYEVRMPRDLSFSEGAVIVEQNIDTNTLAVIEKIVTDPRDPFQRLLAKTPINLQSLKWVLIK